MRLLFISNLSDHPRQKVLQVILTRQLLWIYCYYGDGPDEHTPRAAWIKGVFDISSGLFDKTNLQTVLSVCVT